MIAWIRREMAHVLPVFLFFLLFFVLINWTESYLFEGAGIRGFSLGEIAIAAALIAKIILVVDHLPLIHHFRRYPLAYGILWKTLFYWVVLFIVRLLIRFVPFLWGHPLESDLLIFIQTVHWNVFFSVQVYYLMLLFIFMTFQELTYKIGIERMRELFFGKI